MIAYVTTAGKVGWLLAPGSPGSRPAVPPARLWYLISKSNNYIYSYIYNYIYVLYIYTYIYNILDSYCI